MSDGSFHDIQEYINERLEEVIIVHYDQKMVIPFAEVHRVDSAQFFIGQIESFVTFSCENGRMCFSRYLQLREAIGSSRKMRMIKQGAYLDGLIDPVRKTWILE